MIEVTVPIDKETPKEETEAMFDIIQAAPELGFVYRAVLQEHLKANMTRPQIFMAKLDGRVVGASAISSRRPYAHIIRTGEVAVPKEFRRQRIATALYYAMACASLLEGRRETEETVIPSLSPWMVRSTCEGEGFLLSLNYHHYGTLPMRTGGFRDIELWCKPLREYEDWEQRVPPDTRVYIPETEDMRANFEKNMKKYGMHEDIAPDLKKEIEGLRDSLVYGDHEMVSVIVR